jgi:hypothetical protein
VTRRQRQKVERHEVISVKSGSRTAPSRAVCACGHVSVGGWTINGAQQAHEAHRLSTMGRDATRQSADKEVKP